MGVSGYGIAFDLAGLWNYCNDFTRNILIFGVDNNSSSHADKLKNNFLVLNEGPIDDISGCIGAAKKKFSINFSKKQRQNFAWVCITVMIIVMCLLTLLRPCKFDQFWGLKWIQYFHTKDIFIPIQYIH